MRLESWEHARQHDRTFKALSDPTRRQILLMLEQQPYSGPELRDAFRLAQPTLTRHLHVLRDAGLIRARRNGQKMVYRLAVPPLRHAARFLEEFSQWRKQ